MTGESPPHGTKQWLAHTLRRGFAALQANDIQTASNCCRDVLSAQPKLVQGHFLVGLVALATQDRRTALHAFGSVTQLDPDHGAAWGQLARLYVSDGQMLKADSALANAVRKPSEDHMVHDLVASVYTRLGEHERAREHHHQAMQLLPQFLPYQVNYANALVYHGRNEEAAALLREALVQAPDNPQAHWILSGTARATDEQHIRQMRDALPASDGHPRALAFLYYAMGKEYEDLQQWELAFDAFARGAHERRKTVEYDEPSEEAFYAALEQSLSADWFAQAAEGFDTDGPVFVLGQPRTGTTLIERIITSHSMVHSAGELQQFGIAIRRLSGLVEPRRFSEALLTEALKLEPKAIGGLYMQSTQRMRGDTPRFVDKLPSNFVYLPLILKALPNAKVVHLRRDPMDACFSSFKQLFADAYLHSYEQTEMARHHARYARLMDVWRERFEGRFFDISYEQTVADLAPNARALIDYLQLPWEDACLHFHEQPGAVSTASASQVREPVHTRSVGRWRQYEQQLQPMRDALEAAGVSVD